MSRGATQTFDGLVVGYGRHTVDNDVGAVYQGANGEVTFTSEIALVGLADTSSDTSTPQDHVIPRGSIFLRAEIQAMVAATTGSTSLLDIGTWSRGLATEVVDDEDGILDNIDSALLTPVGSVLLGAGDLIADAADSNLAVAGAISNSDVVIVASFNTAVFTAGSVRVTITYRPPTGSMGRVLAV